MPRSLYAGQGTWVPVRETEAQAAGRRLRSAECLAVCSRPHSTQGGPTYRWGDRGAKESSHTPRLRPPGKAKALGGAMAPAFGLPSFVPEGP